MFVSIKSSQRQVAEFVYIKSFIQQKKHNSTNPMILTN